MKRSTLSKRRNLFKRNVRFAGTYMIIIAVKQPGWRKQGLSSPVKRTPNVIPVISYSMQSSDKSSSSPKL